MIYSEQKSNPFFPQNRTVSCLKNQKTTCPSTLLLVRHRKGSEKSFNRADVHYHFDWLLDDGGGFKAFQGCSFFFLGDSNQFDNGEAFAAKGVSFELSIVFPSLVQAVQDTFSLFYRSFFKARVWPTMLCALFLCF